MTDRTSASRGGGGCTESDNREKRSDGDPFSRKRFLDICVRAKKKSEKKMNTCNVAGRVGNRLPLASLSSTTGVNDGNVAAVAGSVGDKVEDGLAKKIELAEGPVAAVAAAAVEDGRAREPLRNRAAVAVRNGALEVVAWMDMARGRWTPMFAAELDT